MNSDPREPRRPSARVVKVDCAEGLSEVAVFPLTPAARDALPALGLRALRAELDGAALAGPRWAFAAAAAREGPAQSAAIAAARALERHARQDFVVATRRPLRLSSPVVMAIVNVTPDSFSDGGKYASPGDAADEASRQVALGALLVDVGGESTRPGAAEVSPSEEIARTVPVIERIVKLCPGSHVSIDTVKPEVADAALRAGACLVNDISGLRRNPELAAVASQHGAAIVLGHCRGTPATMTSLANYGDVVHDVMTELDKSVELARAAGIPDDRILVDPCLGFSKTAAHNWEILHRLGEFRSLGFPLVIGASRKSFLGEVLGGRPPAERDVASAAVSVIAALAGARVVRVHDARPTLDALAVVNALTSRHAPSPAASEPRAGT